MGVGKPFSYDIQYTKIADKFLKEHEDVRSEYEDAIKELLTGDHPERIDVKRIKGKKNNYFRIRLGQYRVIYTIIDGKIVVIRTLLAGPGGDVYKKMGGMK
ncbi:MAG: type II toxin-antitoxin system RelE/ParE family toxin [Lachnospiraceae bacterium]|nr:type II toxin-antitoxin system RelE/ParE family toxin [Candidatus Darwinimomas equi]